MTQHYPELALAEPVFGELRNCMELAVVGALARISHHMSWHGVFAPRPPGR